MLRHHTPESADGTVRHGLLYCGLAVAAVSKIVVLDVQVEQIADGAQIVADLLLIGERGDQPPLVLQTLDGGDIVGCLERNVDHLRAQALDQHFPGSAPADKQIIVLLQQRLGQRDGPLQCRHLHPDVHFPAGNQGLGAGCQIFGGRDQADF